MLQRFQGPRETTTNTRIGRFRRQYQLNLLLILLAALSLPLSAEEAASTVITTESTEQIEEVATPELTAVEEAFQLLTSKSFKDKKKAVGLIAKSGDDKAREYLQNLLDTKLYYRKSDKKVVVVEKISGGFNISDPHTGEALGTVKKKEVKKVSINNSMRRMLREEIAGLSLSNPDAEVRLSAVDEMISSKTPGLATTFQSLIEKESDPRVAELMQVGISIDQLNNGSTEEQQSALATLDGNLHPSVRNSLNALIDNPSTEPSVAKTAQKTLSGIESKIEMYGWAETLFFGISLGSVLVLAAIGLAITFGVMGVINMAHGELIMLGAYTTYLIQQMMPNAIGWSIALAIPAAFIVSGTVGIIIERTIIRFLYGRPLETLLATFGVSLILQQLVRTLVSPQNVPVSNPEWMSGSLQINSVLSLTYNRLYIIVFCLMVFMALFMILKKTTLGLQVRAVSQNRNMARAMGVRAGRVDALTFGLGAGIAGVAGVALSQLTNVGPNLGQAYIIDSFMVVVFGGVGNLLGTLVAGLSLGVANKIMEPWAGAVLAKILVLVFIILFIQKRPRGLFPQKGRAAEG